MTVQIAHVSGGFACYRTPNGIRREYVGCSHPDVRAAIEHANELEAATTAQEPIWPLSTPADGPSGTDDQPDADTLVKNLGKYGEVWE